MNHTQIPETSLFGSITIIKIDANGACDGECFGVPFQKSDAMIRVFAKDKPLVCPFGRSIGIVCSGSATVNTMTDNHPALLRKLKSGDIFGAATVFSDIDEDITSIVAEKECTVLYFSASYCKRLIAENGAFTMRYIRFLSERICFLNQKIASYTSIDAEQKVLLYINENADEGGKVTVKNASELASLLNIGRASLYRIFDLLEEKGVIRKDGRTIYKIER